MVGVVNILLFEDEEVEKGQRWHGDGCSGAPLPAPLVAAAADRRIDTEDRRARAGMAIACQCLVGGVEVRSCDVSNE